MSPSWRRKSRLKNQDFSDGHLSSGRDSRERGREIVCAEFAVCCHIKREGRISL